MWSCGVYSLTPYNCGTMPSWVQPMTHGGITGSRIPASQNAREGTNSCVYQLSPPPDEAGWHIPRRRFPKLRIIYTHKNQYLGETRDKKSFHKKSNPFIRLRENLILEPRSEKIGHATATFGSKSFVKSSLIHHRSGRELKFSDMASTLKFSFLELQKELG